MRKLLPPALALVACSHAAPTQDTGGDAAARRVLPRVLVVSGANNHDWKWTTPSLVRILEESGRFDVEVTYDPAQRFTAPEPLEDFSAIVLDYNGPRWGEAAEARFLAAVGEAHVGVVVVHAANNAFPGWVPYEELVGDLWRDGTGHGSFHPFDVDMVDRDHPVTRTLPTILKHPDELYHRLVNTQNVERRVLATALSATETGGTGQHEPMIVVKDWHGARVFHTPLGHVWVNSPMSQASHRDPQFRGLLVRGTEWAATGAVQDEVSLPLTPSQRAAGWRDVTNLEAFWQPRDPARPSRWEQRGDCIVLTAGGGSNDLVGTRAIGDFELEFEWKTTIAGNSGVKYRVPEGTGGVVAPEYQLLEAAAEVPAKHRTGSLYDVFPCETPPLARWGEFNRSRIVVRNGHVEHWLNGVRTVAAEIGSTEFEAARAASKFRDVSDFGRTERGRIALQDHGDEVWFRNIRVRDLSALASRGESFLPPTDLGGWTHIGDARYTVQGNELIGAFGPQQRQSFLVSEREFGDFVLELELRFDSPGNSGIQVRSHVANGRLHGYQFEVDTSPRSWSGGLYDEGRRGWLDEVGEDATARAAFRPDGWNHYRIEAIGPRLRAWVNGVQTADHLDAADLAGSLGFQVHGGDADIVLRWRNVTVTDLGRHTWQEHEELVLGGEEFVPGLRVWLAHFGSAAGLATEVRGAGGTLRLGSHELDLARAKGWNAGAANSLEVLRDGQRCAVRLNGMDAGAWDGCGAVGPDGTPWVAVELTMPTGEATSVGPWRRLVPAQ